MATVQDVDDFLRGLDPDARHDNSPDGLTWGDPNMEVRAIGATWMASMDVLRRALQKDINLIVTHEPTFWFSCTPRLPELKRCEQEGVDISEKVRVLDENGIAILRAHNCWDRYPEYGIEASFCRALAMPDPVEYLGGLHSLYEISQTTLGELAEHCKAAMKLPFVRVSGDLAKAVRRIVLAYGASSSTTWYWQFWKRGADAVISGEQSEWAAIRPAIDMGLGVVELGHALTECPGMEGMARLLRAHFPGVSIEHLAVDPSFQYL